MSRSDRGSASLLVLALAVVLTAVATVLAALGAAVVARHRAASAADLAALAAADLALAGQVTACEAASRAAIAVAADLVDCLLDGDLAVVVVEVRPPGPVGRIGAARAVARAGPSRS